MSRKRYLLVRSFYTIILIWLMLTLIFFFLRLMPGSYVDVISARALMGQEELEILKEKWGLDEPLLTQYFKYVINLIQLDAGTSFQTQEPVWDTVKWPIFNSFILVAPGITFAYLIGVVSGTFAGMKRGSMFEKYFTMGMISFGTIPAFVSSIVLIIVVSVHFNLLPVSGMVSPDTYLRIGTDERWRWYLTWDFVLHYILPFSAIVIKRMYSPMLIMRTSVVEVLGQDFIEYYRVTGRSTAQMSKHIGKHSILPILTIYPIDLAQALGGLILIEVVFNWPGIGPELLDAVIARDFPVITFLFFIIATYIILANFLVDILYGVIDPRVTVGEGSE